MTITDIDTGEQREALANRLVADLSASMETLGVRLGLRLGLCAALDRSGPCTTAELASGAGIDARYALEWQAQQPVAGVPSLDPLAALDLCEIGYVRGAGALLWYPQRRRHGRHRRRRSIDGVSGGLEREMPC